jgi:transcriptional regulator with XRE-family HTH domain
MGSTTGPAGENQPLNKIVAANVQRERIKKSLTVAELAARTGCTTEFVDAVERGALPELGVDDILLAFAIALDVPIESLTSRRIPE